MRWQRIGWIVLAGSMALAGCENASFSTDQQSLEQLDETTGPVVRSAIDAVGGPEAWSRLGQIRMHLVLSVFDPSRGRYVLSGRALLDVPTGKLTVWSQTARGPWKVTVNRYDASAGEDTNLPAQRRQAIVGALSQVAHRLYGPWNLVGPAEKPRLTGPAMVGGLRMARLHVTENTRQTQAYYVDPQTNLLRFVTAGSDIPGEQGSVTIYQWTDLPDGLRLPARMESRSIGRYVLLGDDPIWQVELLDLQTQ
ncbi:MAG: hypothetical protein ACOCZE_07810 [Planctomycetota bacterium]